MNIFFYTSSPSTGSKHYLKQLQGLAVLYNMLILPPGPLFRSPLSLKMRSGDLLLLFANTRKKINELLALKNELVDFRIILILEESAALPKAYSMQPRFIVSQNEEITRIEAVIRKIKESSVSSNSYESLKIDS